ncbi:hypothetical protein CCP4SC76_5410029 [Gammaproteobacteria bacterium]
MIDFEGIDCHEYHHDDLVRRLGMAAVAMVQAFGSELYDARIIDLCCRKGIKEFAEFAVAIIMGLPCEGRNLEKRDQQADFFMFIR